MRRLSISIPVPDKPSPQIMMRAKTLGNAAKDRTLNAASATKAKANEIKDQFNSTELNLYLDEIARNWNLLQTVLKSDQSTSTQEHMVEIMEQIHCAITCAKNAAKNDELFRTLVEAHEFTFSTMVNRPEISFGQGWDFSDKVFALLNDKRVARRLSIDLDTPL